MNDAITILIANLMTDAGKFMQGGLAVLGGAVLGAVASGFMTNSSARIVSGRQLPAAMLRFVRVLGGLAGGLAVGWVVFSGVGGTGLGGPGTTTGGGTDQPEAKTGPPVAQEIGITLLGGARVRGGAFYLVDGDTKPNTLADLPLKLPTTPGTLAVRIFDDSVAQDHPAAKDVEQWAKQAGWTVRLEILKGRTMPPEPNSK